jgi:hypothetical protein
MTDDGREPVHSGRLLSPRGPDPDEPERGEGQSEIPWVPAVIAAAAGALIVSAFVVVSLIGGPADGDGGAVDAQTTSSLAANRSVALPEGFTPINDEVGFRVEDVAITGRATVIAVSTAVRGGLDPAGVTAPDVAYWELSSEGATSVMSAQYGGRGALGNITLEFPPLPGLRQPELLAHLAEGVDVRTVTIEFPVQHDETGIVTDQRIDMGEGRVVIIDELTVGDGSGFVAWHTQGSAPAKVTTVVTFVGSDDPGSGDVVDQTVLTSAHRRTTTQGSGSGPLMPMYGFSGSEPLLRSGEPLGESSNHESISVEFTVEVPARIAGAVSIDIEGNR